MKPDDEVAQAVLKQLRLPLKEAEEPLFETGTRDLTEALERFTDLLPPEERTDALELLRCVASTNAFEPLRVERRLPVTVVFYARVHPSYYEGESRIGDSPWRLCYTDGGAVGPSPIRDRLLDEVIRLAEAMHDKNPFGEVPFDGGKTVLLQEPAPVPDECRFQAVTALYGDINMPLFVLAKGGIRYYAPAPVPMEEKREALRRWAASSALAGILSRKYIGGPDMRMGDAEMLWVDAAAAELGAAQRIRQHPAVTGLPAEAGGFPHQAWELTGRTVAASLKEALRHPGMQRYGLHPEAPIRVLIQGFGDVGGSVARLLTEESPGFDFRIVGVADECGAVYRKDGLDVPELLRMRAAHGSVVEYPGELEALWTASEAARNRPEFRGTDGRELILEPADVLIPAAIPNVIDERIAPRLQVRLVAEGANNAVAPHVEETLHRQGVLYLPGQTMNWGGVKGSTLEALFRELTKRSVPFERVEEHVRESLAPLGGFVDVPWVLELLRAGLLGPPLELEETRAFAISILEDLARSNTRWLMDELFASRYERAPLEIVRSLSRAVRILKVQLLSLLEYGLGAEFFAAETSLQRMKSLLDERLKELLSETGAAGLTGIQAVEQAQMLQQLQIDIPIGLSPVFAALLAALDLARQKVMDPDSYARESLQRDLETLRRPDAAVQELEGSLYRLQRVHPGPNRDEFVQALSALLRDPDHASVIRRNAAFAVGKIGSTDPAYRTALVGMLADPDLSVRAACRWALHRMGVGRPEARQSQGK